MSAQPPRRAHGAPHARRLGKLTWRAALASTLAALVAQLAAAPIRADPGPPRDHVRLELTRGPGAERCPDERRLRAETARRMGFDPFDAEAPLALTASIEQEQGELIASMYLRDRSGRVLWADGYRTRGDCETLVSTMALSIAVQLDDAGKRTSPQAMPAAREGPAAPEEEACSAERPCAVQPAPPRKAPSARELLPVRAPSPSGGGPVAAERFRWAIGAGATLAMGLTPGVAVGPTLSVTGRWPAWSVALEARGLSSLSTEVESVRMTTSALTSNTALCLHRHVVFACAVGELGMLRAVPEVPISPESQLKFRAGIGARAGVLCPLSESLAGYGYADVVQHVIDISFLRHETIPESERTLWAAPAVGVVLGLGLQLNL